jgi:Zn-dependent protease
MEFDKIETRDLVISTLALALAFSHFNFSIFPQMFFIIVMVFVTHEIIGHKFIAQRYGATARYQMWPLGLGLAILTGLIPAGFIFAAPGAVYISQYKEKFAFKVSHLSQKEYGLISLGGPLVNIALGITMLLANLVYASELLLLTASISFFLALFNLIPISPLDGSKVFALDRKIWVITFAIALTGSIFLGQL